MAPSPETQWVDRREGDEYTAFERSNMFHKYMNQKYYDVRITTLSHHFPIAHTSFIRLRHSTAKP